MNEFLQPQLRKILRQLASTWKRSVRRTRLLYLGVKKWVFGKSWYKTRLETEDILTRKPHAQNIVAEILYFFSKENEKNRKAHEDSYVFAISGKWGEGKSDLLEKIEPLLIAKSVPVIWYKPWQYAENAESLRRTFLTTLTVELEKYSNLISRLRSERKNRNLLEPLKYDVSGIKFDLLLIRSIFFWVIYFCFIFLICSIFLFGFVGGIEFTKASASYLINYFKDYLIPLISIGMLLSLTGLIKKTRTRSRVTSMDDFEQLFHDAIERFDKIVVFIDDLDRCTPEGVKIVLDSLKTFFRNSKVAYVITADHTVLERYLGKYLGVAKKYKNGTVDEEATELSEEVEGKRFLKKLFDVYWRLPLPDIIVMEKLINNSLNELPDTTDAIQKKQMSAIMGGFLEKNPREINRFIDVLRFSLKSIQTRLNSLIETDTTTLKIKSNLLEVQQNSALLAKIFLIQEKFETFFKEYANEPNRYILLEKELLKNEPARESSFIAASVGTNVDKFIDLVKSPPTFHNVGVTRLNQTPANFFYYSGFAGASEKGLVNEEFLRRLITHDSNLVGDTIASTDKVPQLIVEGLKYINGISDIALLNPAIDNFFGIFKTGKGATNPYLKLFLQDSKIAQYFIDQSYELKTSFLKLLIEIICPSQHNDLKFCFENDPWRNETKNIVSLILENKHDLKILHEVFDTLKRFDATDPDVEVLANRAAVKFFDILLDSSETLEAHDLMHFLSFNEKFVAPQKILTEKFNRIVDVIKLEDDKNKCKLLLGFIKKDVALWSELPKQFKALQYLNSNSTLQRNIELAPYVKQVYQSWNPPSRIPKKQKKRKKIKNN